MTDTDLITGDARPGQEFQFATNPSNLAASTFFALVDGRLVVTRRADDLFCLPSETPVLAHWHGSYRTDGFAMTVGILKEKAQVYQPARKDHGHLAQARARTKSAIKGWTTRKMRLKDQKKSAPY
jgi:hypothetical protein